MKTNLLKFVMGLLLPVTLVFTSCEDDAPKSSLTGLTAFSFMADDAIPGLENINFEVNQTNYTITNTDELPYMADVSALVAEFDAIDKTVVTVGMTEQESGVTENDFSSPVNYVVTAEDGVTILTYQVTVNVSQVNPEGVSWVKENPAITDMGYNAMQAVNYKGKHLAVFSNGGFSSSTKLFKSDDGKTWTEVTLDTNFPGAAAGAYYTMTVHNEKLYITGYAALASGWAPEDLAEVWESTDGETFTKLDNAYETPAVTFASYSFNNALWAVGGQTTFYGSISGAKGLDSDFFGPQSLSNKIRSTSDLTTWTETDLPEEAPRRNSANIVHDGKLYMIGGQIQGGFLSGDVWSSTDGTTWTQNTPTGLTPRMGAAAISYDGQIWLFGGQTELGVCVNDVLVSTDGINWTAPDEDAMLPAEFTGRAGHSAYIDADNKVWIVGGYTAVKTSTTDPDSGEVSYSEEITTTTEVWSGKLNKL
ncbi:DUF6242 domain-containing protein [Carboxylicivirga sp. M1479]|uniref:DUF6242 domain-containing protein n=1 Tax=Carboxylicivirga sp. M1479 TaxID=2594476 RepID=UPI0011779EC4|nr:DUF6242 domain-containing protein [Carboxylicivirga sp. M1479]TRX71843.1 hypothetical protein FNN09_04280 [Carboxylicivirga sp. M1479]